MYIDLNITSHISTNYQDLYGMKETGEEVDDLAALLDPGSKARVLDLCSGNGRHAIAMAPRLKSRSPE